MTYIASRGLRILGRGCAALSLIAAVCGCGAATALKPAPSGWSFTTPATFPVGDRFYVGLSGIPVGGHDLVHVTGARVNGATPGLKVLGVFAVSMREQNGSVPRLQGHFLGGAQEADLRMMYPRFVLHPARDAVLVPDGQPLDWYLVAVVVGTRPGSFSTTGVTVDYEADGKAGTATYAFIIELKCPGAPATPLPSPLPLPI